MFHSTFKRSARHFSMLRGAVRMRPLLVGAVLGTMLLGAVLGYSHQHSAHAADKDGGDTVVLLQRQGDKIVVPERSPLRKRIEVKAVGQGDATHAVEFPASVDADPARVVNILPPLTGRIADIRVKLGDRVRAGQVLAVLQSPDLAQAYADVDKARDALELASRARERAKGVREAGGNATKDYEQAESALVQAQAEEHRATARLRTLDPGAGTAGHGRQLTIVAPVSGVVLALNAGQGAYVNDATASLMTIANLDTVYLTVNVPETYAALVSKGQTIEFMLPALAGGALKGSVSSVGAIIEPDTRRAKVRVAMPNAEGKLKPNMFATARMQFAPDKQIVVPTSALLMNNDSTTVFVEQAPWTFVRKTVELGREDGEMVRIVSGLAAGERVVVKGGVLLND